MSNIKLVFNIICLFATGLVSAIGLAVCVVYFSGIVAVFLEGDNASQFNVGDSLVMVGVGVASLIFGLICSRFEQKLRCAR